MYFLYFVLEKRCNFAAAKQKPNVVLKKTIMKKLLLVIGMVMLMMPFAMKAQVYQLPNGGFETWDGTSIVGALIWILNAKQNKVK